MKIKNKIIKGSLKNKPIPAIKQSHGHLEITPQKIKEATFQLIENHIQSYEEVIFFDLFSGSGQMGIEALSRNINFTYFIENDRERYKTIRKWLDKHYLDDEDSNNVKQNYKFLHTSALSIFKKLLSKDSKISQTIESSSNIIVPE